MTYLRIDRNKFWGWVVVSLLLGLGIGLLVMMWRTSSLGDDVRVANNRAQSAQAALTSAEASLTALTSQMTQLTLDLEAANTQIASLQAAADDNNNGGNDTTPTPEPTPTIAVKSRTVTPSTVDTSGTITMTAKVTGNPTKVTMRIYIKATPRTFDKTYTLKKISTSGGVQTWRATAKAPTTEGTYNYFATAIKGSKRVTKVGVSASSFKVED